MEKDVIQFFDKIHREIRSLHMVKNADREEQVLNKFFRTIDDIQYRILKGQKSKTIQNAIGINNYEILYDIANNAIDRNIKGIPTEKKTTFGRKRKGSNENLEQPLAKLIQSTIQKVTNETPALKSIWTGGDITNFEMFDLSKVDNINEFLKQVVRECGDKITIETNDYGELIGIAYLNRQIKTDISASKIDLKVSGELDPDFKEAIALLGKRSFSVKNYSSDFDLELGETNLWKSFSTPLLRLGYNEQEISKYYTIAKKTNSVNQHINHIRFVYELSGFGQDAFNGIQTADFLLLNNPGRKNTSIQSRGIYVKSTAKLIYNFLQTNDKSQLTKFSISQSLIKN